eukprot:g15764.t1
MTTRNLLRNAPALTVPDYSVLPSAPNPDSGIHELVEPATRRSAFPVSEQSDHPARACFAAAPGDHSADTLHVATVHPVDSYSADPPYLAEFGPDIIGGTIPIEDDSYTTKALIFSGATATSAMEVRTLPDSGSSCSFITASSLKRLIASGSAMKSCEHRYYRPDWQARMVKLLPQEDSRSPATEVFLSHGRQQVPIVGCGEIRPAKIFSPFDLTSSFHQIINDKDTIHLTAFCTPTRLLEWLVMPQGAPQSPGWYMRVINEVIQNLERFLAYLDGVIVHYTDPASHIANLGVFFERLVLHNLKLSPGKTKIGATEADFLGHTICPDGVRPMADKVVALTNMPIPNGIKQLRSLLRGLFYYRKYLPNMSKRTEPIQALMKKNAKYIFTPEMDKLVRKLLDELSNPPTLVFLIGMPDPLDLEAGNIVWAIKRLRGYLWMNKFRILTVHQALETIGKVGDHNARVQRWVEFLTAYDYTLEYRKRPANGNADFLSRLPQPATEADRTGPGAINDPDTVRVYIIRSLGLTEATYFHSTTICTAAGERAHLYADPQPHRGRRGRSPHSAGLLRRPCAATPPACVTQINTSYHRRPSSTAPCALFNAPGPGFGTHTTMPTAAGFCESPPRRHFDVPGPGFGTHTTVPTAIFCESPRRRYAFANRQDSPIRIYVPMPESRVHRVTQAQFTAEGTVDILVHRHIPLWGCAVSLLPDNAKHLSSKLPDTIHKSLGISKIHTSAYHPKSNGGTERVNHTMAQMLSVVVNEPQTDWDLQLPHVQAVCNGSDNVATGLAPNDAHVGRTPRLPLSLFTSPNIGGHQSLDRGHVAYCDLTTERQRRAYTIPTRLDVEQLTAHQVARGRGGNLAVMYETHWKGLLTPSWERESDARMGVSSEASPLPA